MRGVLATITIDTQTILDPILRESGTMRGLGLNQGPYYWVKSGVYSGDIAFIMFLTGGFTRTSQEVLERQYLSGSAKQLLAGLTGDVKN